MSPAAPPRPISIAIETSHGQGSVACGDLSSDAPPKVVQFPPGLVHGRELIPAVDRCLCEAGFERSQIAIVAVSAGPGSYTGVRIGVAAAKALAWALSISTQRLATPAEKTIPQSIIPVLKISSLEAIAYAAYSAGSDSMSPNATTDLVTVVDARRGSTYFARFRVRDSSLERIDDDGIRSVASAFDSLEPNTILTGSGARTLPGAEAFPHAVEAADSPAAVNCYSIARRLAARWILSRDPQDLPSGSYDPHALVPVYLRPSEAEEKRRKHSR